MLFAAMALGIGFQAVVFAVLAKVFAISEGLLPEDERLNKLFRWVTLETGLVSGGGLLLLGLVLSASALGVWGARAFGPLEYEKTLRLVIPAVTTLSVTWAAAPVPQPATSSAASPTFDRKTDRLIEDLLVSGSVASSLRSAP